MLGNLFNTGYTEYNESYEVIDRVGRIWKCVPDGSLSGDYNCEVVSPILKWEDISLVQDIVKSLRKEGGFTNSSCGIHIHVGANKFSLRELINLQNGFAGIEKVLFKTLKVDYSRQLHYCKISNDKFLNAINESESLTLKEFKDLWYFTLARDENPTNHYNKSRYHSLNFHSFFEKGTVEFRLFNGTLHHGKIKGYIQFVLMFVAYCVSQEKVDRISDLDLDKSKEILEYVFNLIGLVGGKFKTCRYAISGYNE